MRSDINMQRLLLMDDHNYDEDLPEILRLAVRGIIFMDGKMLFIRDKYGEVKLPGGGKEQGEDDLQTLVREVAEETGYRVIPESVKPFGYVEEKRLSTREKMIWHQFSYLYFCDVEQGQGECEYSENEKSLGMHIKLFTIEQAIENNKKMLAAKGEQEWNEREYKTLLLIREFIEKTNK